MREEDRPYKERTKTMAKKKKKVPKGYHRMPNGKLMKNSAMKKRKRKY